MKKQKTKIMKTTFLKVTSLLLIAFLASCSQGSSTLSSKGSVALKAKATVNSPATKSGTAARNLSTTTTTISSFKINIENIEFHKNEIEGTNTSSNDSIYGDIELKGPFELNLASGNTSVNIATVDVPKNIYDKIQFELHKSSNTQSDLFGKSIVIKGDINGVSFVFWTDAEEEMKVKFTTVNNIVVDGTPATTTINFNLSAIFGSTSTIDFSSAKDGNGDGIIEISPDNIDGNAVLANTIKDLLEEGTDLEND